MHPVANKSNVWGTTEHSNNSEDLTPVVVPLLRLAFLFRESFIQLAQGKPFAEVWAEEGEGLLLADEVLLEWYRALNLKP